MTASISRALSPSGSGLNTLHAWERQLFPQVQWQTMGVHGGPFLLIYTDPEISGWDAQVGTSNSSGISLGFTEIMPWQSVPLEESLPTCQKGDTFTVGEVKMLEKQTSPPDYLTEAELITLMEKHGIGGYPDLGSPLPWPWPRGGGSKTSCVLYIPGSA